MTNLPNYDNKQISLSTKYSYIKFSSVISFVLVFLKPVFLPKYNFLSLNKWKN